MNEFERYARLKKVVDATNYDQNLFTLCQTAKILSLAGHTVKEVIFLINKMEHSRALISFVEENVDKILELDWGINRIGGLTNGKVFQR